METPHCSHLNRGLRPKPLFRMSFQFILTEDQALLQVCSSCAVKWETQHVTLRFFLGQAGLGGVDSNSLVFGVGRF